MSYSVRELRDNLKDKVIELGIDSLFYINPSFNAVIDRFDSYIADMTLGSNADTIMVEQTFNTISFNWTSPEGKEHSYKIITNNPERIVCQSTEYSFSHHDDQLNRDIHCRIAMEQIAEYNTKLFVTTIQENGSVVYNNRPNPNECSNNTWMSISAYTKEGIMYEQEYKGFEGSSLSGGIENVTIGSMLFVPREGSQLNNFYTNKYDQRTLLRRVKFDIARVMHIEPKRKVKYSAEVQLDIDHGLRDMRLVNNNVDPYPKDVKIEPMSKEQIEEILSKEDPKVAEALKPFTTGRDTYSYDSFTDSKYLYEFPNRR